MSDKMQAVCFLVGANSIFYGEKLLTADKPIPENNHLLFERLGLERLQYTFVCLKSIPHISFFSVSNLYRYSGFRSLKNEVLNNGHSLKTR
jgi:hypothetical protein